jgi:hypothetical protein
MLGTGGFEALDIAVPAGAWCGSVDIDGDRMAVTAGGRTSEIIIVDLRRGESRRPGAAHPGRRQETASSPCTLELSAWRRLSGGSCGRNVRPLGAPPSSSGLGRGPLTAETGVRVP